MRELVESDRMILEAFACAINQTKLNWDEMPPKDVWRIIYRRAEEHKIFPMIMESIWQLPFFAQNDKTIHSYLFFTKRSEAEILTQAQRSADFLLLYDYLLKRGLKPLVMKGIICRNLYPVPEQRPSSDEDLLVDPQDFPAYHKAMLEYGMELVDPDVDLKQSYEVAYHNKETLLYIELHKYPFSPYSPIFREWNNIFEKAVFSYCSVNVYGNTLYTLEPTLHMIYLVLHALKHFFHGGFGIRQIADIVLFGKKNTEQIQWDLVEGTFSRLHALEFVKAIYKIGIYDLRIDLSVKDFPIKWDSTEIDKNPLLLDVMESGVYGASSLDRLHSSNITLEAVAAHRQGRKRRGILKSLFPGKAYLQSRFPYAKKYPFLLPLAWSQRLFDYLRSEGLKSGNPTRSVNIGQERIKLLEQYQIINRRLPN